MDSRLLGNDAHSILIKTVNELPNFYGNDKAAQSLFSLNNLILNQKIPNPQKHFLMTNGIGMQAIF